MRGDKNTCKRDRLEYEQGEIAVTEQNMNKHIFPVPDPKKYLDVTTEIHFQRKNLPRGELVWIPVEGGKEQILIPLDIKDGDTIKVNGRGKYNSKTGEIGDLYVVVHIKGKEFSWKKILLLCAVVVAVISVVFFLFKKTSPPPIEPTETICFHDWLPADCTTPKTCSKCGETVGVEAGHDWKEATCDTPKICEICGMESGNAQGHQWNEATFDAPKTCSICGATEGESKKPDIRVNDIVVFGAYEQDGIIQNGAEGIEWLVLDVQDNYALLLSRYALDSQKYHKVTAQVSWNNCSLREWLNNDFMNTAFTKSQQEVILKAGLDNGASVDRIFLLDSKEVNRYVTDWTALICAPTSYAVSRGAGKNQPDDSRDAVSWWLRSLDEGGSQAYCVSFKGEQYTYMVGNDFMSVRPAMCIDLSKAAWE